jgi:thioredoxin-dependent peroxiredoxin
MLQPGDEAPDFTLTSGDSEAVSLHSLRGKHVVLYFYPRDDTPGCTTEACSFRDLQPEFDKRGAAVFGVSTDDIRSHQKFAHKYDLPFTLLSDPDHVVSEAYDSWGLKKFMGREYYGVKRNSFLIDREGKIAKVWEKVKPAGHPEEVLKALSA